MLPARVTENRTLHLIQAEIIMELNFYMMKISKLTVPFHIQTGICPGGQVCIRWSSG